MAYNSSIKIFLISQDPIGKKMAGPGIRYFEMAKVLSKHFDVILLTPNKSDLKHSNLHILQFNNSTLLSIVPKNSYIITQPQKFRFLKKLKAYNLKLIADLYAPAFVEVWEHKRYSPIYKRLAHKLFQTYLFYLQFYFSNIVLCTNPTQKILYRKMSKRLFFKNKILIVPFGIPNLKAKFTDKDRIYKKFPNIKKSDKVILWGGGVWNWFDPMTPIKAIEKLSQKRDDIKLVFLGIKHPNPKIRDLETVNYAVKYCKDNQLIDKFVFFNFDWTPYKERVDFLLRADVGISCHFDTKETRYSFRTRILDYLWTDLPIVTSKGDYFASLVKKHTLGLAVDFKSVDETVRAIQKIINKPDKYKQNIEKIKKEFIWENNLKELINVLKQHNNF